MNLLAPGEAAGGSASTAYEWSAPLDRRASPTGPRGSGAPWKAEVEGPGEERGPAREWDEIVYPVLK